MKENEITQTTTATTTAKLSSPFMNRKYRRGDKMKTIEVFIIVLIINFN